MVEKEAVGNLEIAAKLSDHGPRDSYKLRRLHCRFSCSSLGLVRRCSLRFPGSRGAN